MRDIRGRGSLGFFALVNLILILSGCSSNYGLAGAQGVAVSNYSRIDGYLDPAPTGSATVNVNDVGLYNAIATNSTASNSVILGGNSHAIGYVFLTPGAPANAVNVSGGSTDFGTKTVPTPVSTSIINVTPSGTFHGNLSVVAGTVTPTPSPDFYGSVTVSGGGQLHLVWGNTYQFQSLTVEGASLTTVPSPSSSAATPPPIFVDVTGVGANLVNFDHAKVNVNAKSVGGTDFTHYSKSLQIHCNSTVSSARIVTTSFVGVVYAPNTVVSVSGFSEVFGSITGLYITCAESVIHYDTALTPPPSPTPTP